MDEGKSSSKVAANVAEDSTSSRNIGASTVSFWKWALFPFSLIATSLLVALFIVNAFVPSVWYMKVYFYFFVVTQFWMIVQFFLYLNYRNIDYDFGDKYTEPVPDSEVTVIVSSYNEPVEILEKTLREIRAHFTGPVIIADDSTEDVAGISSLSSEYKAIFSHREDRNGFKAGAINNAMKKVKTPFIVLLDSDAVPSADFFNISRSYIRHYDFVQFPQYYGNRKASYVAMGAYAQQVPFMFRIMPLRSQRGSAFMLGTNLIYRKEAVEGVGGFDEDSITEDLSTSLKLHEAGCTSVYVNRNVVSNSAPENLRAFFTQQERWAKGTLGIFRQITSTNRRKLGFKVYSDYFIGTSWYIYGFAFLFMSMSVFLFALFQIQFLKVPYLTYVSLFVPYLVLTMLIYYTTIQETGHGAKEVFLNMSFNAICFPIYIKSMFLAIFKRKTLFNRTPKMMGSSSDMKKYIGILPQISLITMLLTSVFVNITEALQGFHPIEAIFNAFWGAFYISLLIPIYLYPY